MQNAIQIKILERADDMRAVETLQRVVWPDNETDVVPVHVLVTAAHNGGLVIGAFEQSGQAETAASSLVGFAFGFLGLTDGPNGLEVKHCSHMLGVHPAWRDSGIGFALKRAQWQMIRRQGINRITWTYDPLLSRNAYLNIARLGAVCDTYLVELYGTMLDGLNAGLPSDRLQVDWWINSQRVNLRLSRQRRSQLDLAHYLAAGAEIVNPSRLNRAGLAVPAAGELVAGSDLPSRRVGSHAPPPPLGLVEIPADFLALKAQDIGLALNWRLHVRQVLEQSFKLGYLITDFVHLQGVSGTVGRSFYVLSYGEQTL